MHKLFLAILLLILLPLSTVTAQATKTKSTPVSVNSTNGKLICELAPSNTSIEFIGTHVGDKPKPRLGGFKKFKGQVEIADGKPVALNLAMEITSIWTEFDNLTKHLMNADFFEANKFPKSKFESSSIKISKDGNCTIQGKLTLHGVEGDFAFPAKYQSTDQGFILTSEFKLDRTKFGMTKMTEGVEVAVTVSMSIGKPTRGVKSKAGNGSDASEKKSSLDDSKIEGDKVTISLPAMT
jgi:polyisoprenoid-binding protein YceI